MSTKDFADGRALTILLTGGRAPVTLELARSFHAAGHRVLVAESARFHLCRVSRAVARSFQVPPPNPDTEPFLAALESIVTTERVDVLIPTCEEIFYVARGLDRLHPHCKVWAPPIEQLRELHDKWRFVMLAERLGLPTPSTKLIQTREDWLALAAAEPIRESFVLKPAYSRFASQVLFMHEEDSLDNRRRMLKDNVSAVSPAAPWVAQRLVHGRHICTYSVAFEGQLIAHSAYPSRYRVGQGASVYFESVEHETSLAWVRSLVQAIRYTGQIAFDFIEEADGRLYAIECNPRATSGVHLFGTGEGLVTAFLHPSKLTIAGTLLTPHASSGAMLTLPMVAAGLGGIRSISELRHWRRAFRSARDVVFSAADPRPYAEQLLLLADAWRTSRKRGIKLVQATTIDIEWNGDRP
ncbi:putative ATP-grasp superfamily ATP-dependent carboligase [Paenibacillus phyllosphaerae]|uniref:Putative ATP-grasp superfamily ATP-dependent carboligase n=1 Tax=Paenibacillus phyllosphaerae TaxID=274593 RepID=A0A7W5AX21_9BACL|nr:ATP-grasp domain-containing protein [Paenibacillus phyllosphaerae]MBB3109686.1 putative ATP-grasp superfamily ATP-dependent carboligase [Paenibacillus phyllosphaerae]